MKRRMQTTDPMSRIHVAMAWIAALSGAVTAVVWTAVAAVAGDPAMLAEAVGPTILAATAITMLVRDRVNGAVLLFIATAHLTITVTISRREETLLAAALGMVVVLAVGALLIPPHRGWLYLVGTGLYAMTVGVVWDGVFLGTTMLVVTSLAGVVFMAVHAATRAAEKRYRTLFEGVPVPLALQDWRPVRARLDALRALGVEDIGRWFSERPDQVRTTVALARMVDANDAFVHMTGADSKEAALAHWVHHLDSLPPEHFADHFDSMVAGDITGSRDIGSTTVDGRPSWLHIDWLQTPDGALPDADRLTAFTDVSDLKGVGDELNALLDAKDQFVASISHELRTPLTAVLGFGESLSAGVIPREEREDVIELLVAEARHMSDIIEDLLVAARARLGEITIRSELVDVVELASKLAKNTDHAFDIEPVSGLVVLGDGTRVSQVLRNLVGNASRYGGHQKRILFGEDGDLGWVEVRDDGKGISPDLESNIFDPYVSGEARVGLAPSIGLGLWVSRELAELMGGSLEYHRAGGETVFRLTLPRS